LLDSGRAAEAIPILERVSAEHERMFGPDALATTLDLATEGEAMALEGRPAEALELLRRAYTTDERAGRPVNAGWIHHRAGDALRRLGRFEEALAEDRVSAGVFGGGGGEEDKVFAWALTGMGEDLIGLGRAAEAVAPLRRALALRETPPTIPAQLASSRFALARALWDEGVDRASARSLAALARAEVAPAAGEHDGWIRRKLAEIDAWLAAHTERPPRAPSGLFASPVSARAVRRSE
jgi:tetratricopeptide (TPR) repeat protein